MKICCISILFFSYHVYAQTIFTGVLLSKADSTILPYASIQIQEINERIITNENGQFSCLIPAQVQELQLEIDAIGCHEKITYLLTEKNADTVYVFCRPLELQPVEIHYISAEDVVKKAVEHIADNYADSFYVAFAFYRSYKKINQHFQDLIEAQSAVMFRLTHEQKAINAHEAFAVNEMRRSIYIKPIDDLYDNDYKELMEQNPIYHIVNSSLNTAGFKNYVFNFDSAQTDNDYKINYTIKGFSTESHGLSNYDPSAFAGEGFEKGTLLIDKETFAIKKIERISLRNPNYHYPNYNNFMLPSKTYTVEFNDGYLDAEYAEVNGKWYLSKITHTYTNTFYRTVTYQKEFTISETFEWTCNSVSDVISPTLLDKFYQYKNLPVFPYTYHPDAWLKPLPKFYLYSKESVYNDIEKTMPVEEQFILEGR